MSRSVKAAAVVVSALALLAGVTTLLRVVAVIVVAAPLMAGVLRVARLTGTRLRVGERS